MGGSPAGLGGPGTQGVSWVLPADFPSIKIFCFSLFSDLETE
jgi:hypothetical protein